MLSLADIRSFHKRNIRRAFVVSDTGGENWGSKVKGQSSCLSGF